MWQLLTGLFPDIINEFIMKYFTKMNHAFRCRLCPVLRALGAVVLIASLGLEILPWGFVECAPAIPGEQGDRAFSIEPLQVCDHGDSFVGVLFDLPVLLPGAPCLFPSPQALPFVQQAAPFVPDGFRPAIDHPPQLPA
jgi:hypothetical protein